MKYWGVHYDVGVHFLPTCLSRPTFDPELIRLEIRAIKEDLHANAVRLVGEDIDRLRYAGMAAVEAGLSVFFNPWFINQTGEQTLAALGPAVKVAEELRAAGGDVTFVLGCEHSLFAFGIIPGSNVYERVGWLVSLRKGAPQSPTLEQVAEQVNSFLHRAVDLVRASFGGPLTYAAGVWEHVDWTRIDMVGLDYYRQSQTDEQYAQGLRDAARHGKPVGVLEFGCCSYVGADKEGGMGWMLLDEWRDGGAAWVSGKPPVRSEATQGRYIADQMDIFVRESVDAVFVFTFAAPYLTHNPDDPDRDFDMCSFSLTKLFEPQTPRGRSMPPWEPKEAFQSLARYFARFGSQQAK
jgi:hypothetical protein